MCNAAALRLLLPRSADAHKGQTYEHQQGRKILADMEHVIDFVQMQRFKDPLLVEVLHAMRTRDGKKISDAAWTAIYQTELKANDPRLRNARGWYESAYEWRFVSYAMHAHAKLDAHLAKKLLFYIPAVDRASVSGLSRKIFDDMRREPNIAKTGKLCGVLPVFEGMEMILGDTVLPPKFVRGSPCTVVGVELHPQEPPIDGRESIAADGCVVLLYMPKCIYVRMDKRDEAAPKGSVLLPLKKDFDVSDVLAIRPKPASWKFTSSEYKRAMQVTRTQIPLLPRKQCTLHGVQGKTAEPGFIVHWHYPASLSVAAKWLACYVSLSRPQSFKQLLSHGLPSRELIEGGPPQEWLEELDKLFPQAKIDKTKADCAEARRELGWPARKAP